MTITTEPSFEHPAAAAARSVNRLPAAAANPTTNASMINPPCLVHVSLDTAAAPNMTTVIKRGTPAAARSVNQLPAAAARLTNNAGMINPPCLVHLSLDTPASPT
jgi:hypothetical protein